MSPAGPAASILDPGCCWTLAAAHTRIREAFQRLGMPLPGALEVMGVRKEPSWRGWGELDEALGFWFVAGNRRDNYSRVLC